MTLEELLSNSEITSDLEIDLGDKGKFKLGDFREFDKGRKSKLSADEKRIQQAAEAVASKEKELTQLAAQAADLMEKLKAEEGKRPAAEGDLDPETDPLYGPLFKKVLKPMQAKIAEYENSFKTLNGSITESAKFILHDYFDRRWRDIPAERRPKDKSWKDYLKVASDKKILNEFGLPDPVEAFQREIEPIERDNLAKENATLKSKVEELTKAASMPRMPRPGTAGVPAPKTGKEKSYDSVDDMINDAFNDPTIQEIAGRA